MKTVKIIALALALVLSLLLVACNESTDAPEVTTTAGNADADTTPAETKPADSADFFVFGDTEEYEGEKYCYLVGVTEEGKKQTELEVPLKNGDVDVTGLDVGCFKGCDKLAVLTVHSNITEWCANLFEGCNSLTRVIMDYGDFVDAVKQDPTLSEGFSAATAFDGSTYGKNSVVEGNEKVRFIFKDHKVYDYFATNYFWGVYSDVLVYEK